MKSINQYINESITSKEDFVIKYVNDMTQNDVIKYDNGNIQFVTKDDNGKDLVIAEFTKDNQFREYYKKSKSKKRK